MFIDEAAITNRVMQWMDFEYQVSAELYYDTTYAMSSLPDAWKSQYEFGNNGDGSIWYPGKPSVIGGTHDIPVESFRMKMLREGMQDYEYLNLLTKLGDGAFAQQELAKVTQGASITMDPGVLDQARLDMADEIEKDMGSSTGSGGATAGSGGATGSGATTGSGAAPGSGGAGGSGGSDGGKGKSCACRSAPAETPDAWLLGVIPLAAAWARRRRR